ncbi:maleylpyruvate isomerase N-terminal domain-containing protein [uncultured Alsobacter sp.]|uniref:maleylpyruvate isomerase N-terminal domain-containing protein n=1 Tax=uncultured Alsobacter sp. TaxID=1748258 RepID=UPI0025DF4DB9|nr:maleylpyruvate isomerase N-terminal domain-containing protein [uncultured Alsobacter sp.]
MTDRRDPLEDARAALRARQGPGARYDAAAAPAVPLQWARLGRAYFSRKLNELADADLDAPSARPGWSRRRLVAASALQARAFAQAITLAAGKVPDEIADTDEAALDLAETLPVRALRHLASHADVHLDVVWRDLTDGQWDLAVAGLPGAGLVRDTAVLRAQALWTGAVDLANGGRLRDAPAALRDSLAHGGEGARVRLSP